MKFKAFIMDELAIKRALTRVSYEIIERTDDLNNIILMGIRTRGIPISRIIADNIKKSTGIDVKIDELDITHFRDDKKQEVKVFDFKLKYSVENMDIILVDDVLYTGRTTRAAMDAVLNSGRAKTIKLAVLIDRGHRELPIKADFVGKNVPTSIKEEVRVHLFETDNENCVSIYENEENASMIL